MLRNGRIARFLRDSEGSNTVEYALVASIVTIVAITAMIAMGTSVGTFLNTALASL